MYTIPGQKLTVGLKRGMIRPVIRPLYISFVGKTRVVEMLATSPHTTQNVPSILPNFYKGNIVYEKGMDAIMGARDKQLDLRMAYWLTHKTLVPSKTQSELPTCTNAGVCTKSGNNTQMGISGRQTRLHREKPVRSLDL